jgi:hypothetical protein
MTLICQGLVFEDASADNELAFILFTVVIFIMLIGTIILTLFSMSQQLLFSDKIIRFPSTFVAHAREDFIGELFFCNSSIYLDAVGSIELPLNEIQRKLTPVQLQEVKSILNMQNAFDADEFISAITTVHATNVSNDDALNRVSISKLDFHSGDVKMTASSVVAF